MYNSDQLQQQIASLKQQQEFQQQLLLQQFRQQQQQLAQEHEKQMQEHIKVQQVGVRERERMVITTSMTFLGIVRSHQVSYPIIFTTG